MNAHTPSRSGSGWRLWLWRVLVLLALALVFMAYQNPHLAVDLANRVWACF